MAIHLGDVIETQGGDLFGDAVNVAARLESICAPGGVSLSEDAWRQVRDRLPESFVDLGEQELKNIVRPMRVYALGAAAVAPPPTPPALAPQTAEGARAVPAALVGVLKSVARLTHAYRGGTPDKAAKQAGAHERTGIEKAIGILETVERIVDVVSDRPPGRDAGAPESPAPADEAEGANADRKNPPRRRRNRHPRGHDVAGGP